MRAYRKQLYHHRPEVEIFGDCYRTCFANIFGLEPWEVPHFAIDPSDTVENEWLEGRGFSRFCFSCGGDMNDALWGLSSLAPGELFIFSGESRTGVNHAVLARDGEIVHDPSLTNAGIIGPQIGEDCYLGEFLLSEQTPEMLELVRGSQ